MQNSNTPYVVMTFEKFDKSVKKFVSKKKFSKLPKQVNELIQELKSNTFTGDVLTINNDPAYKVYKKRLPNEDTNVGKSNGYRVIYIVLQDYNIIGLLEVYYKKEQITLSNNYIEGLIDGFLLRLEKDSEQSPQ